jgi:outer membrane lipoprotein carrier protein
MKRFFFAALTSVVLFNFSSAQTPTDNDPKAKKILDELSKTTKAHSTITAEYSYTIVNKDKKQVDKQEGKIQVKGNKFRLEITGNTIVCNGKKVWNHNKDQQEVSIKCYESGGEDMMDPTKVFTMYETGFKCKFEKEEKNEAGVMMQVISLYPTVKPEKKKYHTAKLYIDKTKKQIVELKLMMKDGGVQTFQIKKFVANTPYDDKHFVFDISKFSKDQVIDETDGKCE